MNWRSVAAQPLTKPKRLRVQRSRCAECQHYYKQHIGRGRCSAHHNGVPCGCTEYVPIGKKVYKTVGPKNARGVIYSKTEAEKPIGTRRYGEEV